MNKTRNALVMVLMFVCGFASGLGSGSAFASDKGVTNALLYSVGITGEPGVEPGASTCTATVIGRNAILTATHCLPDKSDQTIYIEGVLTSYRLRIDDGKDNTLIFFEQNFFGKAKYPEFCSSKVGQDVVYLGYPFGNRRLLRKGYVSGYVVLDGNIYAVMDINSGSGDSGSSIFDNKKGCIIGVTQIVTANYSPGVYQKFTISTPHKFTQQQLNWIQK